MSASRSQPFVSIGLPPRTPSFPLEREGAGEEHFDYILTPYIAPATSEGKLRSLNVLLASFESAGVAAAGAELVARVRSAFGDARTVWGIKRHADGRLGWELYFYDWQRRHADLSIASVRHALAPLVRVEAEEPFPLPWHMISVEVGTAELAGAAASVDVYIDMRSYVLRRATLEMANVYTFHDPRTEIDHVMQRLRSSVHFDWRRDSLADLLPPWLFRCHKLCVANKRGADALYASRIGTDALEKFLETHGWPLDLRSFVRGHASDLAHLLWDVGLDFVREDGRPTAKKTGIYGFF